MPKYSAAAWGAINIQVFIWIFEGFGESHRLNAVQKQNFKNIGPVNTKIETALQFKTFLDD